MDTYTHIRIYMYIQKTLSNQPHPEMDHSPISITFVGSQVIANTLPL